jgi:hypothetical protein
MKNFILMVSLLFAASTIAQTIYHPKGKTTKIAKVETGRTYKYLDDGGASNYTAKTNSILTIYPNKEGEYVSLKCNSFDVGSDVRMYVFDGNHSSAPIIAYVDVHNSKGRFTIKPGQVITASSKNKSGALSIRFVHANKRATQAGWDFSVTTSSAAGTPPAKTSQDCAGAIKVCSDKDLTTKSSGCHFQELPGPGFWNVILNYGNDGENQSNWYKFEVKTSGTIEFLIEPLRHTDFDWALYGPYDQHVCPCWTADKPLRLSAGDGKNSLTGITGLKSRATDLYEDSPGDGFLKPISVSAGQHFVLMIDDWSGNSTTFDLTWRFLDGASLECKADKDPPPIPDVEDEIIEIVLEEDTTEIVEVIEIPEVVKSPCEGENKMEVIGVTSDEAANGTGAIDVKVNGGKSPYSYKWIDENGRTLTTSEDLFAVPGGVYILKVTDANKCINETTFTLTIEEIIVEDVVEEPQIEADISEDQAFVTVSYPGAFEYKIQNMENETVITGHAVDEDVVEITKLPPGKYRVSLIYKKIKQYDSFVKK